MAFEGEPRVIPIKGISRAGADSLCEDGAMNEVIGLEYKDGSYVPYSGGVKEKAYVDSSIKKIAIHKTSSQTNVVAITDNALRWLPEDKFNAGTHVAIGQWNVLYKGKVKDVEFIKNIVCISTEEEVSYWLFQDNSYKDWSVNKEELPHISFRVDLGIAEKENEIGIIRSKWVAGQDISYYETAKSELIAARGRAREEGGLLGFFIVCAAYRLKTGEYIKALAPTLMCRPLYKFGDKLYDIRNDRTSFTVYKYGNHNGDAIEVSPSISDKDIVVISSFGTYEKEEKFDFIQKTSEFPSYKEHYPFTRLLVRYNGEVYEPISSGDVPFNDNVFYPAMSCGVKYDTFDDETFFHTPIPTNKLQYKIKKEINKEIESLIDCLCIYISQEIDPYESISENGELEESLYSSIALEPADNDKYYMYHAIPRDISEVKKDIENINNLYLVHEIPFNDINKSEDWIDIDLKGKLGDNLVTKTTLPISAFDYSVFIGAEFDTYNSRLHMFNYRQQYKCGYHIEDYNLHGGFGQFNADQEVELDSACIAVDYNDIGGNKRVIKHFTNPTLTMSGSVAMFNPLLAFHIGDATKITFYYKAKTEPYYHIGSYNLKKSKQGGYALYLDNNIAPINPNIKDAHAIELPDENKVEESKESMRVSDTFLPQSFPYTNTYTIGNGTIIGLASLSISLSQDTFGSYPLLVFATDGIYSMEVDKTGAGVYTNVPPPFSREVCINRNSICELDGAVLFASNKGLMMATSQGVQEFVPNLNGIPKHKPDGREIHGLGLELYGKVITDSQVTNLINHIDMSDFREYVSDPNTYVTYASEKNKVMIYNGNKPYVYWIDIPTRNATKLPVSIKMDNNDYPTELYVTDNNHFMELKQLSANVNTQTMFQTRPIKLDGGMKTAMRVIVRGYFNSNEADKWAVLLVLGSYDGINWQPLGLKQKPLDGGFNDLGCVVDRVSHKYMMVIFSASLNRDSHIDGIELTKKNKYNNKLK